MMSTPFYKVRQLASSSGWQLRFEGRSDWLPIAAWANVEMCIDGDTVEIIILRGKSGRLYRANRYGSRNQRGKT